MARGTKGKIKVVIEVEEFDDGGAGAGAETKRLRHPINYEWEWTSGNTDGTQMNQVFSNLISLTTTPVDTDLVSASSLASQMDGQPVAMVDPCVVCVINNAASGSGDVQIGAGSNPWTGMLAAGDVANVKPQGILLWVAPYGAPATAGTADILRVVASTGTVDTKVLVAGRLL